MALQCNCKSAPSTRPGTYSRRVRSSSTYAGFIPATTTTPFKHGRSRKTERGPMAYSPRTILVGAAVSFALTTLARAADTDSLGLGYVPSRAQIAGWDIDVRADGEGLPPGHGSVRDGEKIFAETCAACHGAKGEGQSADRLVGGFGTLATSKPVRTVGSYWPYASTLFDYIRRAMPFK